MHIFAIRTGRSLPLKFRRIFRPRPPRLFPHTELFVPLHRNLMSQSVPRSFSRAPGRKQSAWGRGPRK